MSVTVIDDRALERLRRVHIVDPAMWGVQAGTDFWVNSSGLIYTAGRTLITDGGWTATSVSLVAGAGADLLSKDDPGVPGHTLTNANSDLLQSPSIFGDYAHAHMAAIIYGAKTLPRYLVCDAYATWSVVSADDDTTAIGFCEDGGSIIVAADHIAAATSNGTGGVWNLSANGSVTAGVTVVSATLPIMFRIIIDKVTQLSTLYIDGVFQGTIAVTADEFPCAFGMGVGAASANRILFHNAHVWYAWSLPSNPQF